MNLSIKKAKLENLDEVLSLYPHLFSSDDLSPSRNQQKETWKAFTSNPAMTCLIAKTENIAVGTCSLVIVPNLTRGCRPYCLIENVVVHTQYRKTGIGRALMEEAIKIAKQSSCYKIMLLSGADNKNHAFYEKLGFDRNSKVGFQMSFR